MTLPLADAADVLKAAGLTVLELPGWKTASSINPGSFTPAGILLHHDGLGLGNLNVPHNMAKPGVLGSQFWVGKDGVWVCIKAGRADHAGVGPGWGAIPANQGNTYLAGVETDHTIGQPWTPAQTAAITHGCAALVRHYGWNPQRWCAGHLEYAPGRKIDPEKFDLNAWRKALTMTLIKAADAAFPPDLSTLESDVKVILGYVGAPGHTPHIWTRGQVDTVRDSGRAWWPIWVPAQGELTADAGAAGAAGMAVALGAYGVAKTDPVFYDIERSSWEANASGARAAAAAFQAAMRAAGYSQAHPYTVPEMGSGWIANWIGNPPATLPAGVIGQQYKTTGNWDYSMFDASLLAPPATKPPTTTPPPTPETEQPEMFIAKPTTPGTYLLVIPGTGVIVLADGSSVSALQAMGLKSARLSDRDFAHLKALIK